MNLKKNRSEERGTLDAIHCGIKKYYKNKVKLCGMFRDNFAYFSVKTCEGLQHWFLQSPQKIPSSYKMPSSSGPPADIIIQLNCDSGQVLGILDVIYILKILEINRMTL